MKRRRRVRRLFVTGGTGFLGRCILGRPEAEPWDVIAPSSHVLDLRDAAAVSAMIREWKPTAIVHTAYRKSDPDSTVAASGHVARAASAVGARLVHVSSDAIFAGRMPPYTEVDPPRPVFPYGQDKADAEVLVATACPDALIVRTSLIYGRTRLSVHEETVRRVIDGEADMAFFTDEVRSPVIVDDLAASLVELADRPDITGILHLAGPDALSRAELATMTARRQGWDASKLRFSTLAESGLQRPSRVVLDSGLARSLGFQVAGPGSWS